MVSVRMRTAAGPDVGLGHAGRLAGLAEALIDHGAEVEVNCDGDDQGLLSAMPGLSKVSGPTDWVVSDLPTPLDPSLARSWAASSRLCLIDDPGGARAMASIVVGPPTSAWEPAGEQTLLVGPDAVLVRTEFANAVSSPNIDGPIVVTLGGSRSSITGDVVRELNRRIDRTIRVVTPWPLDPPLDRWRFRGGVADALEGASLVVTAFGHSLLEASVMHVPALYGHWAAQDPDDAAQFAELGTAVCVGPLHAGGAASLAAEAVALLADASVWQHLRRSSHVFHAQAASSLALRLLRAAA